MKYRLLSLAETELAEAARWYESQASGLGQEFLEEFEAVMGRITRFPDAWTKIGARHRRCLFRKITVRRALLPHGGGDFRDWGD